MQRLAWARLGLSTDDLEWFLNLDATGGTNFIRIPYQQDCIHRTTDMSTGIMLSPPGNSFHPARGIGQGDTPSIQLLIAVFDILITLLDTSGSEKVYAYVDDLVHLAPTLELRQQQEDLVCGFCAFTGLEISLKKVEAILVNHGNIHNTLFLILPDWAWRPHRVSTWIMVIGSDILR